MADSEDEYDRKRRDKFRGERSAGGAESYRPERRDERRPGLGGGGARDEWAERNPFRGGTGARPRPDYYRGGPRDRYGSPPPAKRMRQDWGDDLRSNPRYGGYEAYMMHAWNEHYAAHNMHNVYGHGPPSHMRDSLPSNDTQTQPAMLTLKQFLDTQDDGISDAEVLRKYTEYKLEFKRQQLNEFFVAHKDEEWFKNKYHPIESVNRKEEQLSFLKRRVDVFNEVLEKGLIKQVSIDTNQTDPLLRLLDTVVIKLEGGTDDDLKVLDEKPKELPIFEKKIEPDDDVIITAVTIRKEEAEVEETPKLVSPRPEQTVVDSDTENWDDDPEPSQPAVSAPVEKEEELKEKVDKKEKTSLKRKRTHSNSSSSSSTSSSSSSSNSTEDEDDIKITEKYDLENAKEEEEVKAEQKDEDIDIKSETAAEETSNADNENETNGDQVKTEQSQENEEEKNADEQNKKIEAQEDEPSKNEEKNVPQPEQEIETIDLDTEKDIPMPRALHRTSSIFLRNLAPTITKAEIENLCKGFDGFLRVAIADPLAERRWYRRGWVTFKRDVNIKEICWNLNNTRLRDCEMGAIVNRDLSRRVRPVNGMTTHKSIVRADIKLCAKVAMILDDKFKLWEKDQPVEQGEGNRENGSSEINKQKSSTSFGFKSNNPVLQNITDFLIEEASAEEEELLGISGEKEKDTDGEIMERDPQLIAVLDNLILYLRIVHSVDFYNHCEYPYEDEMPNRCGIIHARGPPPSKVSANDLQDYMKSFENKMQPFLSKTVVIDNEELKNLGCKNAEAEVEKFVQSNTQELAKDKWLCPLSGKKFKGPEFIRKHIFNKHAEKVDEVRKEVEYYNNYLKDPKRPQLPEHPGNNKRNNSESNSGPSHGYRAPMYPSGYPMPYGGYAPPMMIPPRGGRGFGVASGMRREMPMDQPRRLIGYHDLDAPANFDVFD